MSLITHAFRRPARRVAPLAAALALLTTVAEVGGERFLKSKFEFTHEIGIEMGTFGI